MKASHLSLRNIEQVVRCVETLIIFEDKEKSTLLVLEQMIMVFLSFVYITDKKILMGLINKELMSSELLSFVDSDTLNIPGDNAKILDNIAKSFILILFSKLVRNQVIHIQGSGRVGMRQLMKNLLYKLELEPTFSIDDTGVAKDNCLYDYIDHTINNLLLFDIVK